MKHVLLIPTHGPMQVRVVYSQTDIEDLMESQLLEFWDYHLGGFQAVWLHNADEDEAVNMRATVLCEDHGRDPSNPPLHGPVVLKGVNIDGDWIDVPPNIVVDCLT
jgi:hypothetical protein